MSNNQIVNMIEQRIRSEVRPQAMAMADEMRVRLEAEVTGLGCSHYLTSLHKFVDEVCDQYSEKLVNERYSALVDKLLRDA
jgi:glutamate racemase